MALENLINELDNWIIYFLPFLALLFIFKGLKMFKALLAISCALSLGFLGWLIGMKIDPSNWYIPCTIGAVLSLIGLWLSKVVHSAGTFILGASVAFMLYPSIQGFVPHEPNWLPVAATAVLSLLFGIISALMKDKVVVLVTSIYGAGLFTHSFFLILAVHNIISLNIFVTSSKTYHTVWLSLFTVLTICGIFSQSKKKN
jgi:hypothetical protein